MIYYKKFQEDTAEIICNNVIAKKSVFIRDITVFVIKKKIKNKKPKKI